MKTLSAVLVAAVLASTTLSAAGAPPPPPASADFNNIDANKDGGLSFDEARVRYPTLMRAIFNMADSDDDGFLDEGEFFMLKGLSNDNSEQRSGKPLPP